MSNFPEEIVVEILGRLPLRSLHRFKWVSKSWAQLITHRVLPSIPPSPLLGFFYQSYRRSTGATTLDFANISTDPDITASVVDAKLSFLPYSVFQTSSWSQDPLVIGSSNGLLLCDTGECYYVCNPATESWTNLKGVNHPTHILLDFDGRISPHYRVVTVNLHQGRPSVSIGVFCSQTGRWERRRVDYGIRVTFYNESAIWNGAVYLFAFCNSIDGDYSEVKRKVMRFGLSERDSGVEIIEPPMVVNHYRLSNASCTIFIGRLWNKLCFAFLDTQHLCLSIWSLQGNHETEWVMEHSNTIVSPITSSINDQHTSLQVVGFHPLLDAVLIRSWSTIFAYDPKNASFDEVCRIPLATTDITIAKLLPFSPCSFDLLENHED